MSAFFIFNNLKVNTFRLYDQPFPGFSLLCWEHEASIPGTLWDMGVDAGYTPLSANLTDVSGQIWLSDNIQQISELEYFIGVHSGLTEPIKQKALISTKDLTKECIDVTVYKLKEIKKDYIIINDGKWSIRGSDAKFIIS